MPLPHRVLHRTSALALCLALACGPDSPGDTGTSNGTTSGNTPTSGGSDSSTSASASDASTSSDPTTSGGGGSTSDTSTGCSFLDCQGSTSTPNDAECDPWVQDCPDGQKCAPWANDGGTSWNALKCVDVMPNAGQPGDECTVEGSGVSGIDSCEKASMCWNVSQETGKGTCVAFCTGSEEASSCADPDTTCVVANMGVLILCLTSCDPLTQNCPNMDLCIPQPMGDLFVCVLDASGDMGKQNDPCEFANACDPGLICANPALATECDPMSGGCCLPFCDIMNPDCTNQGAMCLPWYDMGMAPPGLENVGVCGIMQ